MPIQKQVASSMWVARAYKRKAVRAIPEDWCMSLVGREFTIQLGKMLDAARNTGVAKPYIGNRAVQWGQICLDDLATAPMTPADLQRFRLHRGDLLVCEGGEIGRAALWDQPIHECYYQKALHRLRPTRGYDSFLMMCFLQLWTKNGHLANYVTQTSIAHLPKDRFELVPLPAPPLFEQRATSVSPSPGSSARHHNDRFRDHLDRLLPQWRLRRDLLNRSPLAHEDWGY
jgi:type I restriction enzyme S subunit